MSANGVKSPTVYVIAGPNGAGKTTFANEFLPDFVNCREFLNADLIAAGLSPFAPETQNLRAGRLLLTRIKELTKAKQDFGFETTLAGRGYVPEPVIRRRFESGIRNLFHLYRPRLDVWWLYDASRLPPKVVSQEEDGELRLFHSGLFEQIKRSVEA